MLVFLNSKNHVASCASPMQPFGESKRNKLFSRSKNLRDIGTISRKDFLKKNPQRLIRLATYKQ